MPPIDLNPHDLEIVLAILRKFVPDREVWAFGSRVKWTAKPFSDLDLAIVGEEPLPISIAADLAEAFDESELPIKVDVVDWATTSDAFRQIIEREKVVVQQTSKGSTVSPAPTFGEEHLFSLPLGWSLKALDEVCERVSVGHVGETTAHFCESTEGIPFIRSQNVRPGELDLNDIKYVSKAFHQSAKKSQLREGDLLIVRVGANCGDCCVVPPGLGQLNCANIVFARPFKEFNGYIGQYFRSSEGQQLLQSVRTGSAQSVLNTKSIAKLVVPIPPVNEALGIARLLESIDAKQRVSRKATELLTQFAASLHQSWFVSFDPVKAKAQLKDPFGIDPNTAALFPSELVGSDVGEIPDGWSATTLGAIVSERTAKVGNDQQGHIVLSAVATGELKRSDEHFTKQVYSQDTAKYKRVEQWDYAYNPSRINIGSIGMLEEPIVGAVSPVYTVLRPAEGYEWFLRFFLDLPQTKETINQFCSGSVRQSLSFKDFAAIPVVLPPKEIAEAFTRRWQELNALRQKLAMQSSKLAEVRDTLLPRLMSGELRVPDELMA